MVKTNQYVNQLPVKSWSPREKHKRADGVHGQSVQSQQQGLVSADFTDHNFSGVLFPLFPNDTFC